MKVSFDPNELQVMDSEEEYKFYEDYISLIRNIEEDELKFRSVSCSKSTALLIDGTGVQQCPSTNLLYQHLASQPAENSSIASGLVGLMHSLASV